MSAATSFRPLLRPAAGAVLLLALATGCGIRPTAVPVDAGAPASRTACPTVVLVPTAPATPSAATPASAPTVQGAPPAKAGASPSPSAVASAAPSAAPSAAASGTLSPTPKASTPKASTPPADNAFSAMPSASPTAICR
ncbi:hypothetical protein [Kitasatospora sp. NPDC090091]|uniref:hypothetical protein n=1 Tax=Kitasatospora sp. NPDC090091 TaxID=3364081 RepID=UPI0038288B4B